MKKKAKKSKILLWVFLLAVCVLALSIFRVYHASKKYAGHGFAYMNGYSSTDFSEYMVYSNPSKLASLDTEASLRIENEEDMPILDGAEACYPLYAAFAKAVYRDIDVIEEKWAAESDRQDCNGKIVTFTNSVYGFSRLLYGEKDWEKYISKIDVFFGARPSEMQDWMAEEDEIEIEVTPIAKEAFVFFVEADNPVENLTSEQFKAIYHGDITNWSEVGGRNQKIVAFQRPRNSGSQTMMEHFMEDVPLMEAKTYQVVDAMSGVVDRVAQFANEKGALGYSFRYFLEELNQERNVKLLSIDGVSPTLENIENGTYPLVTEVCAITRKDTTNPYVQKMIDFILSEEGQEIVRKTGYAGLNG